MNRDYAIEKQFLTRSYDSSSEIELLLEDRYSITGGQKPFMVFGKPEKQAPIKLEDNNTIPITKERKYNTRTELKNYFQQTLANQKRLIKKIQAYNRSKSEKPFPVKKMLHHYKIPEFEDFIPLNTLWQKYTQELLFPQKNIPPMSIVLPRLSSADLNGCLLTVLKSKNHNLVGTRGIVVCDTQHSFIICVPRNEDSKEWNENKQEFSPLEMMGGIRVVLKKGSLFGFDVVLPGSEEECIGFTIIGSRFEFRTSDRSGKKFKNHNVDDL
ncbi:RNase P/MRP, p29 subunit [Suhomyces tanzawaensis NRRL Y-17324]|uniref:Ribonuclease P protein subunit n=1 Tax=Suhomyces tanzawaensis NRRL Y-17324 TaxID=984487 RepID=A0A1E4SR99_9ASCO|nr:RNase P/MRP, p29 subunit [Suhomyces tanzawaensis NRRL Y-17324]ODV81967.1 RNase P/MRP, p29 subunit [Suhomyces tanzawaensis NRRL Y-17324]